jgi:hypothetical protein
VLSVLLPRNVPGFQTGGYTGSHYYDAPQGNGTTYSTYEGPYPQPPMSPWVQPGMPEYDTSHWQGLQQPPIGPSPRSEPVPWHPVAPVGFTLPPGVAPQQSPGPMSASWSPFQGSAGTNNVLGGSYSPSSANESYSLYNPGGFVGQQNPPPTSPPRSQLQGSAGEWNVMAGPYSHSGQSANGPGSYSPHPSTASGFFGQQNPRPQAMPAASPYQGPPGVQNALGQYP